MSSSIFEGTLPQVILRQIPMWALREGAPFFTLLQNTTNNNTNGTSPTNEVPDWLGWVGVVACIIAWGTFGLPLKVKWIKEANMNPVVFQFYFSSMVLITSFVVLIWNDWYFSFWGILSAGLWVPASLLSLVAIHLLGLGVAQGVWSGVNIITSFTWGVALFHSEIGNAYLTALALILMVIGIVGIATCSKWNLAEKPVESSEVKSLVDNNVVQYDGNVEENSESPSAVYPEVNNDQTTSEPEETPTQPLSKKEKIINLLKTSQNYILGILCSIGVGVLGGSQFVPSRFEEKPGVNFVIGFGFGSAGITSLILVIYYIYYIIRYRVMLPFHPKVAVFPCITACLWQVGNIMAMYVSMSSLGFTIGLPLTQASLVVAGVCGLVFFKELRGWKAILQFFISALVFLIPGCIILSLFGKK